MITVVPPVLLVRLFGVPESIAMPRKVGDIVQYAAHGRQFQVKRVNRDTWHLRDLGIAERSRFGTVKEIADDVGSTLETGALPGGNKGRW